MSPSLREERKVRTRAALAAAALELFADRGYGSVTVAEVAAAAHVGERTLYRYFPDKEDLLFGDEDAFRAGLHAAIEDQPAGDPSFMVLRESASVVARALEGRREEVRQRGEVIAGAPALAARERAKQAAAEAVLVEGLRRRGVAGPESRLLARITIACYDEATVRWLSGDAPHLTLLRQLDAVYAEVAALMA